MTGRDGLQRQLGSAEIVAQVALARSLRAVGKVVFMGMGEPAHNLDNVLDAIDLLGTEGDIGHKNLVFSTVGDLRVFERLPRGRVRPALALSLHSTFAAKRAELLPRAPRIDPAELVELGERYARATHYPIQYQWTLLDGINDGDDELDGIARLLAGQIRGDEPHPLQRRGGARVRARRAGARGGDRARAQQARRPHEAPRFRRTGRRRRLRAAAGACGSTAGRDGASEGCGRRGAQPAGWRALGRRVTRRAATPRTACAGAPARRLIRARGRGGEESPDHRVDVGLALPDG